MLAHMSSSEMAVWLPLQRGYRVKTKDQNLETRSTSKLHNIPIVQLVLL